MSVIRSLKYLYDKALQGAVALVHPEKHLGLPGDGGAWESRATGVGNRFLGSDWHGSAQGAPILGCQESRPAIMCVFNGELGKREPAGKLFLSPVGTCGFGFCFGVFFKISLEAVMVCQCFS